MHSSTLILTDIDFDRDGAVDLIFAVFGHVIYGAISLSPYSHGAGPTVLMAGKPQDECEGRSRCSKLIQASWSPEHIRGQ